MKRVRKAFVAAAWASAVAGCTGQPAPHRAASVGTVGIYGVVTGLGGMRLDGLRVATAASVPLHIDGLARPESALLPGHVAAVVADDDSGAMQARRIDVWHEVSGPVEARDAATGVLTVAGQRVRIDPSTRGDRGVAPGDWVQVSGLREVDGTVVASRLDRTEPGPAIVSGRLDRVGDEWRIGGIQVIPPGEAGPDVAGEQVVVAGAYGLGVLTARSMVVHRGLPFPPGPTHFIVQAYAQPEGGRLRLGPNVVAEDLPDPRLVAAGRGPAVVELRRSADGGLHTLAFATTGSDAASDAATGAATTGAATTGAAATGAAATGAATGTAAGAPAAAATGVSGLGNATAGAAASGAAGGAAGGMGSGAGGPGTGSSGAGSSSAGSSGAGGLGAVSSGGGAGAPGAASAGAPGAAGGSNAAGGNAGTGSHAGAGGTGAGSAAGGSAGAGSGGLGSAGGIGGGLGNAVGGIGGAVGAAAAGGIGGLGGIGGGHGGGHGGSNGNGGNGNGGNGNGNGGGGNGGNGNGGGGNGGGGHGGGGEGH